MWVEPGGHHVKKYDDEGTAAAPETRLQAGEVVHTFAVVVEDMPRVTPFGR